MLRLSFSHKLSRRLLAAGGIACASLVATTVLASPAVAAQSDPVLITSSPEICDLFTGQASTSWTIISLFDKQLTITVDPSSTGTVSPTSATTTVSSLNEHPRAAFSQVLGSGADSFKISFHITGDGIDINRSADVTNTCHAIDNPISVTGVVRCDPSGGGATVSWAVTNNGQAEAIINDVTATPAGATVDVDRFTIAANETKSLTETTAVDSGSASIELDMQLNIQGDTHNQETVTSKDVPFTCASPSPSPSSSASPSMSASPSVSASSSGSMGAIPVGGAETGGGGGRPVGNLVLGLGSVTVAAGAGAGLMLARRRRKGI